MNPTLIWYNNIPILWENPTQIFPYKFSEVSSTEEKINSIIRAIVLALAAAFILKYDIFIRAVIIAIIVIIIMIVYYESLRGNSIIPNLSTSTKKESFTPSDYPYRPTRQPDVTDRILNHVKSEYKFNEMPNQDHLGYFHQIDRDDTKYNIVQKGHLLFKRNLL